ncbi:acetate--CoA ligase [Aspergillus tubingensis]|uniref:acetate--CoA ligase n=1 Tax=Aspergillus tubingensis TaxID=5068 RepID=UPI0015796C2A|nr:acetyl-coenzyme A synthetase FacA [Aspergillus tubingensis]GFN15387.1 acetyl-coenzyme A synthetase FacA [Aspergillus tubingensis]
MASDVMTVAFEWRERHPSQPHLGNMLQYHDLYKQSIESPSQFWSNQARELLWFTQDFHTPHIGSFEDGYNAWFLGGQLNASFNCIDRHMIDDPDRVAIIYEPDDPNQVVKRVTYGELLGHVSKLAGFLRSQGVKKGDIVTIYMSMVPEVIYSLLACARIGAVHSVVFAGFSAAALRDRIVDANSKVVITADEGRRGGKSIPTKHIVDEALKNCPCVSTVLIYERTGSQVPCVTGRDFWWNEEVKKFPTYISPEPMDSEDYLFMLYTSGSTGKPKGVLHSTAGYLLGAAVTGKYVFDVHKDDIFFCAGDIGWITGHTYVAYAPLLLGCTTVMFEGTPAYPSYTRYWEIIAKHAVTHFYAAPTALRLLKRSVSKEDVAGFDTSSLRVLGSVGEPIAPEVWKWYSDFMGNAKAYITDTYWQTETGSHIIAAMAGVTPMKPGCASLPCFGIDAAIIDPVSGKELEGYPVEGVLAIKQPWPSMARTIRGDHRRYMESYLDVYKGYYFTGDGAFRDFDGHLWIRGRIDDVINVSGHRLSTSEIESAAIEHGAVAEIAVIGVADDLTGQAINAFVSLKTLDKPPEIENDLVLQIRRLIGPFAVPKKVIIVRELPKTRSGKNVRRILRKIASGDTDFGDTSTLADPGIVNDVIQAFSRGVKRAPRP